MSNSETRKRNFTDAECIELLDDGAWTQVWYATRAEATEGKRRLETEFGHTNVQIARRKELGEFSFYVLYQN